MTLHLDSHTYAAGSSGSMQGPAGCSLASVGEETLAETFAFAFAFAFAPPPRFLVTLP